MDAGEVFETFAENRRLQTAMDQVEAAIEAEAQSGDDDARDPGASS
jgi:hypothetical protein